MNIAIFGSGYVGTTTGACLADQGHTVVCVDVDEEKVKRFQAGNIPFFEPGLEQLVRKNIEKARLRFTTEMEDSIASADVIFNCVGTPQQEDGSADLQYVFAVAETIAKYAQGYKILVNKSTVPVGTARRCTEIIHVVNPASQVEVVSNPEFLAEGKAVYDFTHPNKIVVGAATDTPFSIMRRVYMGRTRTYIPFVETNWETAEMIKYANNSFLATKISFSNEIANICDHVGADTKLVAQALGMDYRINPRFLNAGVGYGGSCFPKDVRALIHTAKSHAYEPKLLQEVDALNERQKLMLFNKAQQIFGDLTDHKFTLWGASFKPNTSDVREAPALQLAQNLCNAGAIVCVYDPIAQAEAKQVLGESVSYAGSIEESVQGSSAIFLVTEWDEFRNADFLTLKETMKSPILLDGRNIYEPEFIREEGFEYYGVGRG